uniref:HMG box domain-containing protein n=1 Tax=Tetraselmis chuii TaxID=63592 RepID=A0A7S1X1M2_9CHLO|mmetsp:Transcript_22768/g.40540  ORF Transcript_22768/g.40540 Transcript_22768/m.40540 type:complete len:200 (+) Transcript_22768:1-600(+)
MSAKVDAQDPPPANGEPEFDEDELLNDPEYQKRCEAVAVTEWYATERIAFEQRALGALETYKRTGTFKSLFPPLKSKGKKKGKDGEVKAKRNISAYNLYIRYEIEKLKSKGAIPPNAKITETIKGLGATWSQLSDSDKATKAKSLFERHQKENPGSVIPEAVIAAAAASAPKEPTPAKRPAEAAPTEPAPKKKGRKPKA